MAYGNQRGFSRTQNCKLGDKMNKTKFSAVVLALAFGFFFLTYPSASEARVRNLHAFCASHRNDSGPGEGGDEDLPQRTPVSRPATWRCQDGKVLVCALGASGDSCSQTSIYDADRRQAFEQFCRENPGSNYIPHSLTMGLHSEWRCNGRRPLRVSAWPTDQRGYVRGAWKQLP